MLKVTSHCYLYSIKGSYPFLTVNDHYFLIGPFLAFKNSCHSLVHYKKNFLLHLPIYQTFLTQPLFHCGNCKAFIVFIILFIVCSQLICCVHVFLISVPDEFSSEDLVVKVDSTFAKSLYKQWENTVQV